MHECSQRPALLHDVLKQVSQTLQYGGLHDRAALDCLLITVAQHEMQCIKAHSLSNNSASPLLQVA